ncbi:hypothetical protein ABES58_14625 [Paenibacillus lautus]|uniref:hypothetical protein n=1 Tax=Paenibacillus lautus TaxID=1401 RepID=UPI003D2948A3
MPLLLKQANEPFGSYIPNGSFAFTPSPNHRQGGSNHPRRMVEAREAKLGAEQSRPRLATKHGIAVLRLPTSFLSKLQRSRRNCSGEA